jgi:hypothetical protein
MVKGCHSVCGVVLYLGEFGIIGVVKVRGRIYDTQEEKEKYIQSSVEEMCRKENFWKT